MFFFYATMNLFVAFGSKSKDTISVLQLCFSMQVTINTLMLVDQRCELRLRVL